MLLALVGEPNRLRHEGAEIALALLSTPELSVVVRTLWRVKDSNVPPGIGENRRPDFQELLSDVRLAVWVRASTGETGVFSLAGRLQEALTRPASLSRFGALSLGESTHLVDEVRRLRSTDCGAGRVLIRDSAGDLALPVWPDHVGAAGTHWGQYRLVPKAITTEPEEQAWTPIRRPHATL
jgi:CRISPR-associated protein Cas5t